MSICHPAPCERLWKMWPRAVILVLFLEGIVSSQSVTSQETEAGRPTRQLNFGECCPCSDSEPNFRSQDHWLNSNTRNLEPNGNGNRAQFSKNGFESFRSNFDDCPCRQRTSDSEGSSSIFFPSALRPNDPSLKSGLKEDPKNLLEPEVGLASSVLETLKRATDEEYREALARDSARARAAEDAVPEESAPNIVTIILPNQDDEDLTSGSHIQEPRCIRPLGSPISRMRTPMKKPPNVITEIFRLPRAKPVGLLHRHNLDIDSGVGASNILERVVDAENGKRKLNRIFLKNDEDVCETNFRKGSSLKSVPLLEKEVPEQNNVLRSSNINNPKIRLDESPRDVCKTHNTDLKSAASDTKELFALPELKLGSFTPESPLNLKSLLKLRDVDILPPAQLIDKLKLGAPPLQLPPLIENMPKLSDLLKNGIKFNLNKNGQWNNAHDGDDSIESSASNIQVIPREKAFTTEILDGEPSTSNMNEVKYNEPETLASSLQSMPVDKIIVTESSKSLSRSTDANNGNSHDVFNNPLQKISKVAEDDCHSLEGTNGDATSNELNLSRSNGDVPTPHIESQEDISPNARSNEADQELDASDRLGTIENEQKSAENDQQEAPSNDVVFKSKVRNQNLDEEKPGSPDTQAVFAINDNKKLGSQNASPLGKSLTSVREAILRKLEERKRPTSNKAAERREINDMEVTPIPRSVIEDTVQDCQNEATRILTTLPDALNNENIDTKLSKASGNVQFSDLQRLSDALLKKSLAKEKSTIKSNELIDDKLDIEDSGINNKVDKLIEDNRSSIDSGAASDNQFSRVVNSPSNRNALQINNDDIGSDNKEDKEETCSIDLRNAGKSLGTGPDVNEMAAEASESVIGTQWHDPLKLFKNSRLNSPLFQDVIVQPTSLFDGIGNTPGIDLPGSLNLPTLDDIRERLANVFSIQAKDSSDEEFDCMNENPIMAAAPSTSKFISKSPAMPLEDLNLDIFQLKPLSMGKSSALSKTPGLNLKSFRTKIPVPKNLDFKPVRLQSTVGNDGGLLGAALSLGRNEDAPKLFDSLGNSLQNLPTLEEMMSRVRSNVENIVSPLDSSRSSSSTPLISDFSNNIRSNTENTIRALQSRMRSSLGQTNNVLTNARSPHELIERIADAKEDLDAKFKGLQYDLNDRLTSIHENLLDKTVLPSLNPLFQEGGLSRHAFDNQNTRFKTRPAQASKKFKSESKKDSLSKTANFKNKLKTNTNTSPRTFKMPTAASVPVPKTVEVPKLKSIMDKSLSDIENNMKMKPISSRTNPLKLENKLKSNNLRPSKLFEEHSALGKQASPLKKNKVKVTFGSTTPAPISTLRSQERTNSNFDGKANDDLRRPDNGLRRRFGLQQKSNVEPHESPSEVQPIFRSVMSSECSETPRCDEEISSLSRENDRIFENTRNAMTTPKQRTNLKSKSATSDISRTDNGSGLSRSLLPLPALPKIAENTFLSKVREAVKDRLANYEPANPVATALNSDIPRTGTDFGLPRSPLSLTSWPKIADNSFLSKVKEVVKDRVTNFDPLKPFTDPEPKTAKSCAEMERSASQNTEVVHVDSLKENVSYQCKMVCTKS